VHHVGQAVLASRPSSRLFAFVLSLALSPALAQELHVYPEYQRPDIYGGIVRADQSGREREILSPAVPRNGYASFIVVAKLREPGPYRFDVAMNPAGRIHAELYRLWFHRTEPAGEYYPDALLPIQNTFLGTVPDADNGIPEQTAVAFWLDLYVPRDARRETVRVEAVLQAFGRRDVYPMEVRILPITIPDLDPLEAVYEGGDAAGLSAQVLFRERRGLLLEPMRLPAPGAGWEAFEAQYGPLFDGSAFHRGRRPPRPVSYALLMADPRATPAEAALPGVLAEVRRHFTEKQWKDTRVAIGLISEDAAAGFPWNRDAAAQPPDAGRLRRRSAAAAGSSPFPFVLHNDSSLDLERHVKELRRDVNHWIVADQALESLPGLPATLRRRGDKVWFYSPVPGVTEPLHTILWHPARAWMWAVDGFVLRGGPVALVYAGNRFGQEAPVPSIRLHVMRNALQDLALLDSASPGLSPANRLRSEFPRLAEAGRTTDWWPAIRRWIYQLAMEAAAP
jgi:hypothetical protein